MSQYPFLEYFDSQSQVKGKLVEGQSLHKICFGENSHVRENSNGITEFGKSSHGTCL
jgi:hypothetical protein